jgi:hypothetical protein
MNCQNLRRQLLAAAPIILLTLPAALVQFGIRMMCGGFGIALRQHP